MKNMKKLTLLLIPIITSLFMPLTSCESEDSSLNDEETSVVDDIYDGAPNDINGCGKLSVDGWVNFYYIEEGISNCTLCDAEGNGIEDVDSDSDGIIPINSINYIVLDNNLALTSTNEANGSITFESDKSYYIKGSLSLNGYSITVKNLIATGDISNSGSHGITNNGWVYGDCDTIICCRSIGYANGNSAGLKVSRENLYVQLEEYDGFNYSNPCQ